MRVEIISVAYTLIKWWTLQLVVSVSECFSDLYSFRRNTLLEFTIGYNHPLIHSLGPTRLGLIFFNVGTYNIQQCSYGS